VELAKLAVKSVLELARAVSLAVHLVQPGEVMAER
jgi:hypothetical protein